MKPATHGKLKGHIRCCDDHENGHGFLYPCPSYDPATLLEIETQTSSARRCFSSPEWRQGQIDKGIPPLILDVFSLPLEIPEC
jgi:hypothetical protein